MNYISVDMLSDFEFHDAEFILDSFDNRHLTVKAACLNIHKDAAQNSHETDMEIASARITFKQFHLLTYEPGRAWKQDEAGNFYSDETQIILSGDDASTRFLTQLKAGITILDLGRKEAFTYYIDAMSKEPFFTVCFTFESVVIEWDNYKKEAWYTSRK